MSERITQLSKIVDHQFSDPSLALAALTHPSLAGDYNYQRLEFLGDRVLGLCIADMVYHAFPDEAEGVMNRRLAALVRKEALAQVSVRVGLQPLIRLERGAESEGARDQPAVLADVCEAVIAALYLDGGLPAARAFVERALGDRLLQDPGADKDAKTALQEWAQQRQKGLPVYEIVDRRGPDHAPLFRVRVTVAGETPAEAEAASKRQGEQAAAGALLAQLAVDAVERSPT